MKTYIHTRTHIYKFKKNKKQGQKKYYLRDLHTGMHKKIYKEASVQLLSHVQLCDPTD